MAGRAKYILAGLVASIGLYCVALNVDLFAEPRSLSFMASADTWLPPVTEPAVAAEAPKDDKASVQESWLGLRSELASCGTALPETSVALVGDVMLSRAVMAQVRARSNDWNRPFDGFRGWLSGADIAVGNLETSITEGRAVGLTEMVFRADPPAAKAIADAGFDLMSLANNHTPNFGEAGLRNTFDNLSAAGVRYVGAGMDDFAAWQPVYLRRNGLIFAFVAFNDGDVVPASYAAAPDRVGTAVADERRLQQAVSEARLAADVVMVLMHSGSEYAPRPNGRQTVWAKAAIDAGADIVVGHHPHVVQTLEMYKSKPIIYSLGNFVFDQTWSQMTREGLGVRAVFVGKRLARLEFEPLAINADYYPVRAGGETAKRVLDRLSLPLETDVVLTAGDDGKLTADTASSLVFEAGAGCAREEREMTVDGAKVVLSKGSLSVTKDEHILWATSSDVWVESVTAWNDLPVVLFSLWRNGPDGRPQQRLAEITLSGPDVLYAELSRLDAPICELAAIRLPSGDAAALALTGSYGDWPGCLGRVPRLYVSDGYGWRASEPGPEGIYDGLQITAWGDDTLIRLDDSN